MMMTDIGSGSMHDGAIERTFGWLARLLAAYALVAGLAYWSQLTGMAPVPSMRFDLIAYHERIFFTTLALLLPTAALGLWLVTRWGVVLWVIAATGEILAYGMGLDGFPERAGIALANAALLCALVLMSGAIILERRARRNSLH